MFEIEKDNFIIIILIFVLLIGIFVSSNPDFVNEITGKFVGITGKAVGDCSSIPSSQLVLLKDEIDERLRNVGQSFPWNSRWNLAGSENVSDIGYILELRDALIKASGFYYNLDTTSNLKPRINGDYPIRVYDWNELYRQTVSEIADGDGPGISGFANRYDTSCIRKVDLEEIEKMTDALRWIWLPTCCTNSIYNFYTTQKKSVSYWKKGVTKLEDAGIHESFGPAWDAAKKRYDAPMLSGEPYDTNKGEQAWESMDDNIAASCEVANYGSGQWYWHWCPPGSGSKCSEQGSTWGAERYYRECTLKNLNLTGLPFEPEEVKIYYGLARCDGNCEQMMPEGEVKIGSLGSFSPSENQGDYLINDFNANELKGFAGDVKIYIPEIDSTIKPADSIPAGESRTTGPKYIKGINKNFVFRGFVVSPYGEENNPPVVEEVKFELSDDADILVKVDDPDVYKNEKVKVESTGEEYKVVREYDPVVCNATISDPDDKDNADGVLSARAIFLINDEKYIDGPMLDCKFDKNTKKTYCKDHPVDLHQYRSVIRGSKIKCKVIPKDKTLEGEEKESEELVVAKNIYYFIPLNHDSYGTVKEQYDKDYHEMSEVDKKFNSVGKPVFLKRINHPDTGFTDKSYIEVFVAPLTSPWRTKRIKSYIIDSVLGGSFDPSNDFIVAMIHSEILFCTTRGHGCFTGVRNIYILGEKGKEESLTHGYGHIIGIFRDEYSLKWWYLDSLFWFNANVIGQDRNNHFPHCCLRVCCEIERNVFEWKTKSDCPSTSIKIYYPHQVVDSMCDGEDSVSCGTPNSCSGMPYKDGEPVDDSFNRNERDSYKYSIMGLDGVAIGLSAIYPDNAPCPLKNCG